MERISTQSHSVAAKLALAVLLVGGAFTAVTFASERPEAMIPLDKLSPSERERLRQVIPDYTFHRKVVLQRNTANARYEVLEYLLNHLDETSMVAQPLKIVEYRSERRPDGSYFADNRKGSAGSLWPLLSLPGERLYFAQGSDREGKQVEGKAVVLLRYRERDPGTTAFEMHAFVKVESWIKQLLAKIFLPLVVGTVDKRFGEVLDVPVIVAELAATNPGKVLAAIDSLPAEDRARLEEFRQLVLDNKKPKRSLARP